MSTAIRASRKPAASVSASSSSSSITSTRIGRSCARYRRGVQRCFAGSGRSNRHRSARVKHGRNSLPRRTRSRESPDPEADPEGDQMRHVIHNERLTRSRRARMLAVAAVLSGVLAAGCGASAGSSSTSASIADNASAAASTGSSATAGGGARTSGSTRRGHWRSRGACVPTACRTSPTRAPEAQRNSPYLPERVRKLRPFRRRGRSAETFYRAAVPPAPARRRTPRPRRCRSWCGSHGACAEHGVPQFPTLRPPSRPSSQASPR